MVFFPEETNGICVAGQYTCREILENAINTLRKVQEKCDAVDSVVHVASLSGGAGGGLTDRIIERLVVDYSKQTNVMLGVFPSNNSG
jgi:hypothetical protein